MQITHQKALAWLREKNIQIFILPVKDENNNIIGYCDEITDPCELEQVYKSVNNFHSYEEVVEAALKYSLENLM